MKNVISDRVAYFLKDYPPFSELEYSELEHLATQISVRFCEQGESVFRQGIDNTGYTYVLRQGGVRLSQEVEGKDTLVDECEPGDIFGVRSTLSGHAYVMSAVAIEESLIYAIPRVVFLTLFEKYPRFALFFASGYAAGQAVVRGGQKGVALALRGVEEGPLHYSAGVLVCSPGTSIQEAAVLMRSKQVGSIVVVNDHHFPVGMVTDHDLRDLVVAAGLSATEPVSRIMSAPVLTTSASASVTEVQMVMIRSGVHHLILTADGTDQSRITGVVSDHDVLMSRKNHPAALIKAIRYSDDVARWAAIRNTAEETAEVLLNQGTSVSLVAALINRINDTIVEEALKKAVKAHGLESVPFCWLALGSEGREEQMLRTDQDNAVLFEDQEDNALVRRKLLIAAEEVVQALTTCGFEKCPAEIMASNEQWCQPLSTWKKYFSDWIRSGDPQAIMYSTIFLDYRRVYGAKHLTDHLDDHLKQELKEFPMFLNYLAKNALQNPPPLSFFRNLLVERSGEHAHQFDIKKRAMMPLTDMARLLCLEHQIPGGGNTVQRFRRLKSVEVNHAELMEEAAQAYEIMMRYRTIFGLKNRDSGRYVPAEALNKLEKQILKNTFQPIKELQDILEIRFKLAYFH